MHNLIFIKLLDLEKLVQNKKNNVIGVFTEDCKQVKLFFTIFIRSVVVNLKNNKLVCKFKSIKIV